MKDLIDRYLDKEKELNIIDIGSAIVSNQFKYGSYKQFMAPKWSYTGADIEKGHNVDIVIPKDYVWPFESKSFDVVISGQTLEHVEYPWSFMREVGRIMKVGGICIIIAPAVIHEHRYPLDTFRYYSDGMRSLAKWAFLDTIETKRVRDGKIEDTYLVAKKI